MREENKEREGWLDGRMDFAAGLGAVTERVPPQSVCLTWRLVVWCVSLRSSMWRDAQGNDRANTLIHHTPETREHTVLLAIFIWIKQNICHANNRGAVQHPYNTHRHIHTQTQTYKDVLHHVFYDKIRFLCNILTNHQISSALFDLFLNLFCEPHKTLRTTFVMNITCFWKTYPFSGKNQTMAFGCNCLHYDGWGVSKLMKTLTG